MMRQQLAFDPFLYSDGALATVSGGLWTNCVGLLGVLVDSTAIAARGVSGGDAAAVITMWSGSATDQFAQVNFVSAEGGVTLRSDDADNFILVDFAPGDAIYIFEVIDGTHNQLDATIPWDVPVAYGDVLYAEIQGTTILVKHNEQPIGTRTATGAIAAGKPGIYLVEEAMRANWSAGDFQAPSPELVVGLV